MSVTVTRPNGQTKIVAVTLGGGGSTLNGNTSDNSDTTYIIGTADLGYTILEVASPTLTATQRVQSARVDIRNACAAGGHIETVQARFRDPVNGKTGGAHVRQIGSTTIRTFTGPETTSYPGGIPFTQVRMDRMQLECWWLQPDGGPFQRVHELYVNWTLNTQPAVTSPTATGTGLSRPTLTWSYSDTENDPQTAFVVRAFSSAQYGIAGFNPETSPFTVSSGQKLGNQETYTLEADLKTGVQYKLYVKAGQDWDGPEGSYWWSDWVATSAFTLTVATPPPLPTLTVTQDLTLPNYRNRLAALAPLNLLTLQDSGIDVTGVGNWVANANCTVSRTTGQFKSGSGSLQLNSTASGNMSAILSSGGRVRVRPNTQYTARGSSRPPTTARSCRLDIQWFNSAGTLISTTTGSAATDTTAAWTDYATTGTAPANAYTATPVPNVLATAAGGELHNWDELGLQLGSSAVLWNPGGTVSVSSTIVERLDRLEPTRGAAVNWAHPQLATTSGYAVTTDGFTARQTSDVRSAALDVPAPAFLRGARMIVWHPFVGAANMLDIGGLVNGVATDDPLPPYLVAAVPGRAMTASVYLRGTSAVNARLVAYAVDAGNTTITTTNGSTVALPTGSTWTRYTATITPGAGSCYLRLAVELTAATADIDVMVYGIQVELGSAATTLSTGRGRLFDLEDTVGWEEIRPLELSTAPDESSDSYVVFDPEAPPGRPVLYRARTYLDDPYLSSSENTPVQAVYMDLSPRNLLKNPFQPDDSMVLTVEPGWTYARSADDQVFHPLGRDGDPVVMRDWYSGRDGSYNLAALSSEEYYLLEQIVASARPVLFQFHDGGQSYAALVQDRSSSIQRVGTYRMTVNFLEKRRP